MSHACVPSFTRIFIFHGRCFIFFPMSVLLYITHTFTQRWTGLNNHSLSFRLVHFFQYFYFQCRESTAQDTGVQVQIHRNRTVLLGIHFSPSHTHCSWTSLFSCTLTPHKHIPFFLLLLFCSSTALVPLELQQRLLSQCAHQLGYIRVYYLISPTIQLF